MTDPNITADHFVQAKCAVSTLLFTYEYHYKELMINGGQMQSDIELHIINDNRWANVGMQPYVMQIVNMAKVYFNKRNAYVQDANIGKLSLATILETFNVMIRTVAQDLTMNKSNIDARVLDQADEMRLGYSLYDAWTYTGTNLLLYTVPTDPDDDDPDKRGDPFPLQQEYMQLIAKVREDLSAVVPIRQLQNQRRMTLKQYENGKTLVLSDAKERLSFGGFLDVFANACQVVSTIASTVAECVSSYDAVRKANFKAISGLRSGKIVPIADLKNYPDSHLLPHQLALKYMLIGKPLNNNLSFLLATGDAE